MIGSHPRLYSYQSSLPYLPVPSIKNTITRVNNKINYIQGINQFKIYINHSI
jgi:hypothetical protein